MTEAEPAPGTVAYIGKHGGTPGRAFSEYIKSLIADETLTPKERELVFIGVQTALNLEDSLKAHIPRALKAGATKEEIAAAMMIAVANGGVNGALRGMPLLLETQADTPMWLALQLIVNGLAMGALYALIALGFAMIYNGTRILHLAHGAVFASGGYMLYVCAIWLGLPVVVGLVVAVLAAAGAGALMEILIYRPLRERGSSYAAILVASLGLLTFCQAMFGIIFGTDTLNIEHAPLATYSVGNLVITQLHVIIAAVTVVVFPILLFITRTRYGRAIRALADNPQLAVIFGVNTDRLYIFIFALGSALAAIAAALISYDSGIRPTMGFSIMFIALVAVIVGGIGYLPGAAAGGVAVGLLQNLALWPLSARWQDVVVFGLLILLLLVRPQGLFGHKQKTRRA